MRNAQPPALCPNSEPTSHEFSRSKNYMLLGSWLCLKGLWLLPLLYPWTVITSLGEVAGKYPFLGLSTLDGYFTLAGLLWCSEIDQIACCFQGAPFSHCHRVDERKPQLPCTQGENIVVSHCWYKLSSFQGAPFSHCHRVDARKPQLPVRRGKHCCFSLLIQA